MVPVYFVVAPRIVLLDVAGPAEAFRAANKFAPGSFDVHYCGPEPDVESGLAGLRLGFVIGPRSIIARFRERLGSWPLSTAALVIGAAAYAKGDQKEDGVKTPLDSVDPFKLTVGLTWQEEEDRFGGQIIGTYSDGKSSGRVASATAFRPDDFLLLDATAYWNISEKATLRAGLFNIFDKKYWWWSDVRGVAATSSTLDSYTQPGRNISASLTIKL